MARIRLGLNSALTGFKPVRRFVAASRVRQDLPLLRAPRPSAQRAFVSALFAAFVVTSAFASAAFAQAGSALHITWSPKVDFGEFSCTEDNLLCTATLTADVRSNLSTRAGIGINSFTLMAINGSFDPCNRAIDRLVFVFPAGELWVYSDHIDCPAWIRPFLPGDDPGPRIDTTFQITGGTGAFEGATGGGTEHGYNPRDGAAIVFNGTIFIP
jgi:hypothetical protein